MVDDAIKAIYTHALKYDQRIDYWKEAEDIAIISLGLWVTLGKAGGNIHEDFLPITGKDILAAGGFYRPHVSLIVTNDIYYRSK